MDKEIWLRPKRVSNIGGEALMEGVMMRGKSTMASTVRKGNGELVTTIKPYVPITKRHRILGLPIIRGAISMIESMVVGIGALMESAEYIEFEEAESKFDKWIEKKFGDKSMTIIKFTSVLFALVMGIGLFMLLPNLVADLIPFDKETASGAFLANIIEGGIRIGIFLLYVWLVSKSRDMRRVFQYHGAEHKTIYAYENMEELTVENVRKHTRLHPRCGTTFIFVVVLISILIFALTGWHSKLINMVIRLALLPVIAGVSYELFKLAARSNSKLVKLISVPGLLLQKITTQEPDDSMLEVAIASLKAVLEAEEGEGTENDSLKAAQ
ncbi:DUF1385 domain-containing protein [Thermoclostridium caenicola]|uniref:Uncharacterized conserved protein YqhQ n=1 Tax=Thermoclostridium caenicola TaxID=659425 RepID=A0A1M6DKY2_9FIRM|nr:DUF1385 domain-containing protein [Thermoclostridium caenicola]SHI73830.1 Uncharacterized conserved protein YqhQ [Thermoclostridium caenicola]